MGEVCLIAKPASDEGAVEEQQVAALLQTELIGELHGRAEHTHKEVCEVSRSEVHPWGTLFSRRVRHVAIPRAAREGAAHSDFPFARRILRDEGPAICIAASTHKATFKCQEISASDGPISGTREPIRVVRGVVLVPHSELGVDDRALSGDFSRQLSEEVHIKPIGSKELRVSSHDVGQSLPDEGDPILPVGPGNFGTGLPLAGICHANQVGGPIRV